MQASFRNDQELQDFKNWTLGLLRDENIKSSVCVTFTKKDGSERIMSCTLVESRIPADKRPKSADEGETTSTPSSACRVFDTGIGEWRSFRWESVSNVEFGL
jgi:hypothetical protein